MSEGKYIRIGYWKGKHVTDKNLPNPNDYIDLSWNGKEKENTIKFLKGGKVKDAWMGSSDCRICGKANGSECLIRDKFIYPSGYVHYIEEHGVKPPKELICYVMGRK